MPREDSPGEGRVVLSDADIARVLKRIAHEILEANKGASDLVLLGIPSRGVLLAQRLAAIIAEVEGTAVPTGALDITMYRDDLRKQPTRTPMPTSIRAARSTLGSSFSSMTSSTPAARCARRSTRSATTGDRGPCVWRSSSTGVTVSCRSAPTTSARTSRRPIRRRCACGFSAMTTTSP